MGASGTDEAAVDASGAAVAFTSGLESDRLPRNHRIRKQHSPLQHTTQLNLEKTSPKKTKQKLKTGGGTVALPYLNYDISNAVLCAGRAGQASTVYSHATAGGSLVATRFGLDLSLRYGVGGRKVRPHVDT